MLCTLFLTAVLAPSAPSVDDWPQWRGPERTGISSESEWSSKGQTKPAWTASVGLGYSSMSIANGKLYTAGWDEASGGDVIYCLDAKSGKEIWHHSYGAQKWAKFHGGGTNCTPSVDGDNLYVLNREGKYTMLDSGTGEMHWSIDLTKDYDLELPTWGFAASPLVLDDMVVVHVGKVLAFKKGEPELLWSTADYGHAYATPTACHMSSKDVLAVMGGKSVVMLDRSTGKELASSEWETKYDVNGASPVMIDDERLWISSGYGHGGAMVVFTGDELIELWATKNMKNQMSTSVHIGDYLYGIDESVLKCFNLDGDEQWSERSIGKGSLSAAGDRLLVYTAKGELAVVKASPDGYHELSRSKATSDGVCWAMPVIVEGLIYVRSSVGELVALDHQAKN